MENTIQMFFERNVRVRSFSKRAQNTHFFALRKFIFTVKKSFRHSMKNILT